MKTELFEKILKIVSEVTEVPQEYIVSKKRACDIIEARALLIHYCIIHGLSSEYLRNKLNLSTVGINYPLKNFYDREKISFSFKQMSKDIRTKLEQNLS